MEQYSFYVEDYATELKQHLNLSESAWLVIEEDMKNFSDGKETPSFSGFLNRVFANFYQRADASVELRRLERAEAMQKLYASKEFSAFDKGTVALFIDRYTMVYASELREKARAYPNGHGEKFRINKRNLDLLRESPEAGNYDGSIGLYLKAIFEEYAGKPAYLREQIYFDETIARINDAARRAVKVKIALNEKLTASGERTYTKKYYLSPYRIVQDKTNTFNYVIGYSEEIVEEIERDGSGRTRKTSRSLEKCPVCFRISRIGKIDVQMSMGAKISKEHAADLEKMLVTREAMFLSSEPIEVKIRFTPKGLESLRIQRYMRPRFYTVDREDKFLYTFRCTERQAVNYFFKFGWDAHIVEPAALSEKFKVRYERAYRAYCGEGREEILAAERAARRTE